jgi:nucleolar MIF4G domain-containing protein 1
MGSKTFIGTIGETVISLTALNHQTLIFILPDVTSLLTTLVTDGIASHSSLLDSYVVLHAAFVSSLHKIVGLEFGRKKHFKIQTGINSNVMIVAHFVQHVVSSYERYYTSTQTTHLGGDSLDHQADRQLETSTLGKECSNLVALLSELYNFQVISSILIFDIIRDLLENDLSEFAVELLLKIVRSKLYLALLAT